MRNSSAQNDGKSLKTFFIYSGVVIFFIIISLSVKAFFVIKQSKFDSNRQFVLAVAQGSVLKEFIIFHPTDRSVALVTLKNNDQKLESLGKNLGIIPDARVNLQKDKALTNIPNLMQDITFNYYSIKTNLTIFDAIRLLLESQRASINSQTSKEIVLSNDETKNDKLMSDFFTDDKLFSENVSIQIINASGVPGLGKRLERSLTNLGGNVLSIATSRQNEKLSKIRYFGESSYTLNTLRHLLGFPIENMQNEEIAKIVIILGEDHKDTENF